MRPIASMICVSFARHGPQTVCPGCLRPARGLANEHEIGVWIANAENDLPASEAAQLAPRAIADVRADGGQSRKGVGCLFRLLLRKRHPTPFHSRSPHRVAPVATNTQLFVEFQMLRQLIACVYHAPASGEPGWGSEEAPRCGRPPDWQWRPSTARAATPRPEPTRS